MQTEIAAQISNIQQQQTELETMKKLKTKENKKKY